MIDRLLYCLLLLCSLGFIAYLESDSTKQTSSFIYTSGVNLVGFVLPYIAVIVCIIAAQYKDRKSKIISGLVYASILINLCLNYTNRARAEYEKANLIVEAKKKTVPKKKETKSRPVWPCRGYKDDDLETCNKQFSKTILAYEKDVAKIEKENADIQKEIDSANQYNDSLKPDYFDFYFVIAVGLSYSVLLSLASIVAIRELAKHLPVIHRVGKFLIRAQRKRVQLFRKALRDARERRKQKRELEKKNKDLIEALPINSRLYLKINDILKRFPDITKTEAVKILAEEEKLSTSRVWTLLSVNGVEKELKT